MPHLYVTFDSAVSPPVAHFYIRADGASAATEIPRPAELGVPSDRKPVSLRYRKRSFIVGLFRRPFMVDEFGRPRAAGVRGPILAPALSNGAFTGGSTGNMIGYQTFLVKSGERVIAESDPGPASNTLAASGAGRVWSNLDWSPQDSHVTHSRGYVGVDGELPAMAWERPLQAPGSTVTENVLTAALSIPLPARITSNGVVTLDPYARGVPPYTHYVEKYHDAFFYAGDPEHPERIYPSRLYEPEAVNTTPITVFSRTENPWLSTTDGMPVTGIKRQGEDLVVGTIKGIDVINGYTHGDYTIRRISDYWGVLSHFSMARCGPLSSLFFAAPQGPTIYNAGTFKFIGGPIETWWRDNYLLYPEAFRNSYASEDRYWRSYKLLLPWFASAYSLYLVCDYDEAEMGNPIWVRDRRARRDECAVELLTTNESNFYELLTGSCDGHIRRENVETNADDDGDAYKKALTIDTPHRYVAGQDGDDAHGRTYVGLDLYLKHENNEATISMWAGDDDAPSAAAPQWTTVSPQTKAPTGSRQLVQQTSERHIPTDLSGKGVTLRIEVSAPLGVEWRGWAVDHLPGPQTRPFKE